MRLGNRGGAGVETTLGVHTQDRSLRLQPEIMTPSTSCLKVSTVY